MKKTLNLLLASLLLSIIILQSGCLEKNEEYPDVTAVADTIFGTVKYRQTDTADLIAWPFGTATFKAIVGLDDVLASATINSDGTFMLILPGTVQGVYLSSLADVSDRQGGTIVVSPETIRFLETIQYKVEYTDNGKANSFTTNLYTFKTDKTVDKSYFFNFYDLDGSFIGSGTTGNVFNWTFTKGWGLIENAVNVSNSNAINSKSISAIPSNAVWVN